MLLSFTFGGFELGVAGFEPVGGGAIATPSPPTGAAIALIKFLPLAAIEAFDVDGRSPINPNSVSFLACAMTAGTMESGGVLGLLCPGGRRSAEGTIFHINTTGMKQG